MDTAKNKKFSIELFNEIEQHQDHIYVLHHKMTEAVPQHTHKQGHILVVLNGFAIINVDRNAMYIPNGYFVWIPSGIKHRISFDGKEIDLLNIYYPKDFYSNAFYDEIRIHPIPSILYHAIQFVKYQTAEYSPEDWRYELLATMKHILPNIIIQPSEQLCLPTTNHPIVKKIIRAIQNKYQSQITAQNIAEDVGMSVRTMSRYLKKELDTSFVQYLRKYRVIMAVKQMVEGEESLTNISYNVGYESLTVFSNSFFMVTGYRPSQYLK